MALQGILDEFMLADVMRLIAATGKTGCLRVEGDRGRGHVWFEEGEVVAIRAEQALQTTRPEEVMFELLRVDRGSFDFTPGDCPADDAGSTDVETLLQVANRLLLEWSELERVVPSLKYLAVLSPALIDGEVSITAPHWRALSRIGVGRTVGELAEVLRLSRIEITRNVRDLVHMGLVTLEAPGTTRRSA